MTNRQLTLFDLAQYEPREPRPNDPRPPEPDGGPLFSKTMLITVAVVTVLVAGLVALVFPV